MSLKHLTDNELLEYHKLYKNGSEKSVRFESRKIRQQDSKFLYHIIRLFDEAEQILLTGDFNMQRAKEVMKAVRRGDWTAKEVRDWAMEKEKSLEVAYVKCDLPDRPDEAKLRSLLKECLECHYGNLKDCVEEPEWANQALLEIDQLLGKVRNKLYN
jgi:signal recognition particle GTPase